MMKEHQPIGEQIRVLRLMRGYSMAQVSRISGVNYITIRRLENGECNTHYYAVCEILDALGCEFVIREKKK